MSIRLKLTITFLILALLPSISVSLITFSRYKNTLENSRLEQLRDIVSYKADKIDTYFSSLKASIGIAQGFYNIKTNLPLLDRFSRDKSAPQYLAAKNTLDAQLRQMQRVLGLADIMLISTKGKVLYTSNPAHFAREVMGTVTKLEQDAYSPGRDKVYFSDIYNNPVDKSKFAMMITAPAMGFNGSPIGVIVFEIDMTALYQLVQEATGLGQTGETLIGKKVGDTVIYLNPLRHDPQAALTRSVKIGGAAGAPIQKAVRGETGSGQAVDYRGEKVIAAWSYVPLPGWGVVGKIDTAEAFADVNNLMKLEWLVLVLILCLGVVVSFSLAKSISEPIKKLTNGAAIIGRGNLDHKVGTEHPDEIGQLSRSIDKMTGDLKKITAWRDELNAEIAERQQAEEDLKRSNENLEQFAYVASHDLQEPLRVMSSFSQLLEKRYKDKLDQDAKEFIAFIVDAAARMQALISDLLAFSRVSRLEITLKEIDCNEILTQVVKSIAVTISENRATVTSDNLPVIMAHEVSLFQLFSNLVGNALKFRSREDPRIHISSRENENEWIFSVQDNGIGIDPQYAERIFLIFQRLHRKEEYKGTGIGLSICKTIVTNLGGRIWVESQLHRGSTFYFTIPKKVNRG
jgi:signal transduction histidine kinase